VIIQKYRYRVGFHAKNFQTANIQEKNSACIHYCFKKVEYPLQRPRRRKNFIDFFIAVVGVLGL